MLHELSNFNQQHETGTRDWSLVSLIPATVATASGEAYKAVKVDPF